VLISIEMRLLALFVRLDDVNGVKQTVGQVAHEVWVYLHRVKQLELPVLGGDHLDDLRRIGVVYSVAGPL